MLTHEGSGERAASCIAGARERGSEAGRWVHTRLLGMTSVSASTGGLARGDRAPARVCTLPISLIGIMNCVGDGLALAGARETSSLAPALATPSEFAAEDLAFKLPFVGSHELSLSWGESPREETRFEEAADESPEASDMFVKVEPFGQRIRKRYGLRLITCD